MKKLEKKIAKKANPDATVVHRVYGENGDLQFSSTGSALVDLASKGADTFLEKNKNTEIYRFKDMVEAAYKSNPIMTQKIARYFRDRECGMSLKEQPALMVAVLDGKLNAEQILSILMVHSSPEIDGAQKLDRIDFLDLVRILAWHKYLNGKKSKLNYQTCKAMAIVIASNKNALEQVLRYKSKGIAYDEKNKVQVGIVDIIGILRNMKDPVLPQDLCEEYDEHLYPRYRGQRYGVDAISPMAQKQRLYFKGELPKGEIPQGITFEKVLASGDKAGIRTMAVDGRLSTTQVKLNLSTLSEILTKKEMDSLMEKHQFSLFPHEMYAMAKAFKFGTEYTSSSKTNLEAVNTMLRTSINSYRKKVKKNVIFLGDTSGSMSPPLSAKSTIQQGEFSAFMSFFAAHVCGHRVFGIWDNAAHLFEADPTPSFEDYFKVAVYSNANTDVINAIRTTADYFGKRKLAPEVICLISDMQFDHAMGVYGTSNAMCHNIKKHDSNAMAFALEYYKKVTGVVVEVVYWNVRAATTPSIKQDGVLQISGFSANTADIILGITNNTAEQGEKIKPTDILKHIEETYK